jgi:hypothetical protein
VVRVVLRGVELAVVESGAGGLGARRKRRLLLPPPAVVFSSLPHELRKSRVGATAIDTLGHKIIGAPALYSSFSVVNGLV